MKYLLNTILSTIFTILLFACGDKADLRDPKGSTTPPEPVTVREIKNLNGRAVVFFNIPKDLNFLYLRAKYDTDTDSKVVNASAFSDSIILEGFGKAGNYEVELYSVSAGEAVSSPVNVTISPKIPPYQYVFENLSISPTFLGIVLKAYNENSDNLTFYTYKKEKDGSWSEFGAVYTDVVNISSTVKGLLAESTEIGVVVKDRWNHKSEMYTTTLTPYYEEECDKSLFKALKIDQYLSHKWNSRQVIEALWDGTWNTENIYMTINSYDNETGKYNASDDPSVFTIDLGKKYKLSRILMWNRGALTTANINTYGYVTLTPKDVEFWGRNDDRTKGFDEKDTSWVKIGEGTIKRADGSTDIQTLTPLTEADRTICKNGMEVIFYDDAPSVRYVAFRTLRNYGDEGSRICLAEISYFGTPVQ